MQELASDTVVIRKPKTNIKKEIKKYLKYWYLFVIFPLLFFTTAKIYLRYSQNQYLSKITLKFEKSSAKAAQQALNDLRNLGAGVSNEELDAETVVIVSKPILGQVVKNLNLDVSFFSQGAIKEVEYYHQVPIKVQVLEYTNLDKFGGASFTIQANNDRNFTLSNVDRNFRKTFNFNQIVDLGFGKVIFTKFVPNTNVRDIKIVFKNPKSVVNYLEGAITVNIYKSLLMDLSMIGAASKKSEAILKEVTDVYNDEGIKDKNQEAQFTADFIEKRLDIITEELSGIEGKKEGIKREYQITDLAAQAQQALQNVNENTKQVLAYSTQLDLVSSIESMANAKSENLLPTGLGLSAPVEAQIGKYNELVLTRNRVLKQATNQNPAVMEMNKQIGILRSAIRNNLEDAAAMLRHKIGQLQSDINVDKSKIDRFPTQEKIFRSIDRQQNLKEALYLFLLQKREENAINLAVALPKAKVVNPPYTVGKVAPKSDQIQYGALAAGLILPLLFLYVKFVSDTKVHSQEDLKHRIPEASILSEIPLNDNANELIKTNDFSVYAESFRILASNLKYIIKAKGDSKSSIILFTSSVKGEGKTTISMNTAVTLSSNTKVLMIGADIRNPQLQRYVKQSKVGLTDFLISNKQEADDYIVNSGFNENLDILFSGAKAPNPSDLLDMPKLNKALQSLKSKYDYIILDSAPVMLVSDTRHLVDLADLLVYVVKADYTEKEMLDFAANFREENNIQNICYVLNNVKPEFSQYGSKYGYGYYSYAEPNAQKKSIFRKP